MDVRIDHGCAFHPHEKGCGRVRDQEFVEIGCLVDEITCRGGEAGRYPGGKERDLELFPALKPPYLPHAYMLFRYGRGLTTKYR